VREANEKLGMHIKGGLRGHRGNPLDKTDEGVFISKINSGGAAKRDGRLKVNLIQILCRRILSSKITHCIKKYKYFYTGLQVITIVFLLFFILIIYYFVEIQHTILI